MIPSYWQDALAYLTRIDEIMARLIACYPNEVLLNHDNPFQTLSRAVVGQQISVKVADTIWQRLQGQLETLQSAIGKLLKLLIPLTIAGLKLKAN